jgi:hypothetical protein
MPNDGGPISIPRPTCQTRQRPFARPTHWPLKLIHGRNELGTFVRVQSTGPDFAFVAFLHSQAHPLTWCIVDTSL